MHLHIRAKVPLAGLEPEASTDATQKVTQLRKCESSKPEIPNICRSRRSHALADLAHFSVRSAKTVSILADPAHFR